MNRAHAPRGTYAQFFSDVDLVFFFGGGGGGGMFFFWVWDACESVYLTLTFKNVDGFFGQRIGITNFLKVCFLSHSLI